jgi:hypothetical protein
MVLSTSFHSNINFFIAKLQSGAIAAILGPLWAGVAFTFPPMAMVSLLLVLVIIGIISLVRCLLPAAYVF